MQDKTINNALLALRRDGGEAQVLAERLLAIRGVSLPPGQHRRPDCARKNEMRWIVLDALRDGPKTLPELAAIVVERRPDAAPERAYKRVSVTLAKMKKRGRVQREGRVWSLKCQFAAS